MDPNYGCPVNNKKRALYGGSFDPIHLGHLLLAETAHDFMCLDEVIFVPAGLPPHKLKRKRATGLDRFRMIELALQSCSDLTVSRFEIDSKEVSYSVNTIRHFQELFPEDEFFLLVGLETFCDIPHWYLAREICARVDIIIALRDGFPPPDFHAFDNLVSDQKIKRWKEMIVPMPSIGISATMIRERIALSHSIRFLVPDIVRQYIMEKELYHE